MNRANRTQDQENLQACLKNCEHLQFLCSNGEHSILELDNLVLIN